MCSTVSHYSENGMIAHSGVFFVELGMQVSSNFKNGQDGASMKMNVVSIKILAFALMGTLACVFTAAAQQGAALEGKTAEQAYKNIQVLKGIPADQVTPS